MPVFRYQAVDGDGKAHKGTLEAASDAGARQMVRERGLLPTDVRLSAMGGRSGGSAASGRIDWSRGIVLFPRRVSSKSLSAVTRQLSTLIGSDIRIEEALRIVAVQT